MSPLNIKVLCLQVIRLQCSLVYEREMQGIVSLHLPLCIRGEEAHLKKAKAH